LILVLYPLLKRYALARPNPRSSHATPTPQGGGIAVVAATIVATDIALYWSAAGLGRLLSVFGATILIARVGALDDMRPIPVIPRLLLQALAVGLVIYALPEALRVLPFLPWGIERILLLIGGVWFVNLVNFMDGLDWMTVAEVVPITAALAALGALGFLPQDGAIVALALCGATIGFAFFNRPVAKLFLGDVGSLPIGLLVGWVLLALATGGHLAAAARRLVVERFSAEIVGRQIVALYRGLLDTGNAAHSGTHAQGEASR
jgi:UDP-N-acetylmuramyl pentapeptide phosphotransferase/UDP-N-acetylglucosamine-1-phosphate transferase